MWTSLHSVVFSTLSYLSGSPENPALSPRVSTCKPFLPNVFRDTPPSTSHPAIHAAVKTLDDYFTSRFTKENIDTLSVAVVTSNGTLYEHNFGPLRANETGSSPVNSLSMYRLASVSKLFTVLEGVILEQRGVISWCVAVLCACRHGFDASKRGLGTTEWTSISRISSIVSRDWTPISPTPLQTMPLLHSLSLHPTCPGWVGTGLQGPHLDGLGILLEAAPHPSTDVRSPLKKACSKTSQTILLSLFHGRSLLIPIPALASWASRLPPRIV